MTFRPILASGLLLAVALAGCVQDAEEPVQVPAPKGPPPYVPMVAVVPEDLMAFNESVVKVGQRLVTDLYEPTLEVSASGTIYVAGHVVAVATTGTPAYYSNDDGKTWKVLPFAGPLSVPPPVQGSQPPPGDEGFIVAGDDGRAWMADIYLAGFTVSGWCKDGAELCYDNRQAYDRVGTATQSCRPVRSLNDRPWAAYANGTLLLVNNPGGGPVQVGVLKVPPAVSAGLFDPVTGPAWNLCASEDGWIPGIPDIRSDGFFAVPQRTPRQPSAGEESTMTLVTGYASDVQNVTLRKVFKFRNSWEGTMNGGQAVFDEEGTLFLGARNNTEGKGSRQVEGRFILAASQDDGESFVATTFVASRPVRSLYLDGNMAGPGALVVWSQVGDDEGRSDWYVAHAFLGPHGEPVLRNVSLAIDEGPHSSEHVTGSGVGPDGRAYLVTFSGTSIGGVGEVGGTPLSVWIQSAGPRLPVAAPSAPAQ